MSSGTEARSRVTSGPAQFAVARSLHEIAAEVAQLVEWHRVGDAPDSWIVPRLRLLLERSADLLKDAADDSAVDERASRDAGAARARVASHLHAVADIEDLELPDDLVASLLFRAAVELVASTRRILAISLPD